jgi:hypothetical protein
VTTTFVTDTFTAADGTALTSHNDSNAAAWVLESASGNAPIISSNKLAPWGNNMMRCGTVAPQADYTVSADFRQDVGTASCNGFLCTRFAAGAVTCYRAGIGSDGSANIYRFNAGSFTLLTSGTFSPTYQQTYAFSLIVSGAGATVSLTFKIDGSTILTASDTDAGRLTSAGYPGIQNATTANGEGFFIDNFAGTYGTSALPRPKSVSFADGSILLGSLVY